MVISFNNTQSLLQAQRRNICHWAGWTYTFDALRTNSDTLGPPPPPSETSWGRSTIVQSDWKSKRCQPALPEKAYSWAHDALSRISQSTACNVPPYDLRRKTIPLIHAPITTGLHFGRSNGANVHSWCLLQYRDTCLNFDHLSTADRSLFVSPRNVARQNGSRSWIDTLWWITVTHHMTKQKLLVTKWWMHSWRPRQLEEESKLDKVKQKTGKSANRIEDFRTFRDN